MKKKVKVKNRLPIEMMMRLRQSAGVGAHSSKKGKKGYSRKDNKGIECE